jgi:hypothetical protein
MDLPVCLTPRPQLAAAVVRGHLPTVEAAAVAAEAARTTLVAQVQVVKALPAVAVRPSTPAAVAEAQVLSEETRRALVSAVMVGPAMSLRELVTPAVVVVVRLLARMPVELVALAAADAAEAIRLQR